MTMNKRQKIVQGQLLDDEEKVISRLKYIYDQSQFEIEQKIRTLQFQIDDLTEVYDWMDDDDPKKEVIRSRIQAKVYQKQYQEILQDQVGGILKKMQTQQFLTISDYLNTCYEDGFIGSLFDMHGQGVPLMMPLNQAKMVKAIQLDSKISRGLYTRLGEDVDVLKKRITAEISRSIATGASYDECARQLAGQTKIGYNRAVRIARTEGHRIQNTAAFDAMLEAKAKGADILKQWDSTLDGLTRESHVAVDGEFRELEETFSNKLMFPCDPAGGAAEVVNCRCALLQKARWAVDDGFTKMNNFTGQLETFESPQKYDEFKKAFFSDENRKYMNYTRTLEEKYHTRDWTKLLELMTDREYDLYSRLLASNPVYNKKIQYEGLSFDEPVTPVIKTVADCATVAEVEDLFKSQGWFNAQTINGKVYDSNGYIDLTGLDLECAKAIYTVHEKLFAKYPQLVGKLNSIASAKLDSKTYAQCHFGLGHGGITVNTRYFSDVTKVTRSYQSDLAGGFHPMGTTYHSIVTHEIGHAVDDYLTNALNLAGMTNNGRIRVVSADLRPKVMKKCGVKVGDVGREVSDYATKDHYEWFAECFAEYMDSDHPRAVATEFGRQFEELMKKVK